MSTAATSLRWAGCCATSGLIFALAILMVFVNVGLYVVVPKGFFPQQDTGRIVGHDHGRPGRVVRCHEDKTDEFIRIVRKDPAVENVLASVGGDGAQNQGRMFVILKPLNERKGYARTGDRPVAS